MSLLHSKAKSIQNQDFSKWHAMACNNIYIFIFLHANILLHEIMAGRNINSFANLLYSLATVLLYKNCKNCPWYKKVTYVCLTVK